MYRSMSWLFAGVMMLQVMLATPAFAQDDTPKAEVSVGYQWLTAKPSGDDEWEKFPKGWYFDVAGNVTSMLSIVGQVSGNYKHFDDDDFDLNIHTFMAGVRGSSPGRFRGYGQFLVGGVRLQASDEIDEASETDVAFQLGAGVNALGSGNVGLRLGVDYIRVMAGEEGLILGGADTNGFRFIAGVTFGIGSR